jgi:hypothetical protein
MDRLIAFRVTIAPDFISAFGGKDSPMILLIRATDFIYEHESSPVPMVTFQVEYLTESEDGEAPDLDYVTVASIPTRAVALIERTYVLGDVETYYNSVVEKTLR